MSSLSPHLGDHLASLAATLPGLGQALGDGTPGRGEEKGGTPEKGGRAPHLCSLAVWTCGRGGDWGGGGKFSSCFRRCGRTSLAFKVRPAEHLCFVRLAPYPGGCGASFNLGEQRNGLLPDPSRPFYEKQDGFHLLSSFTLWRSQLGPGKGKRETGNANPGLGSCWPALLTSSAEEGHLLLNFKPPFSSRCSPRRGVCVCLPRPGH